MKININIKIKIKIKIYLYLKDNGIIYRPDSGQWKTTKKCFTKYIALSGRQAFENFPVNMARD